MVGMSPCLLISDNISIASAILVNMITGSLHNLGKYIPGRLTAPSLSVSYTDTSLESGRHGLESLSHSNYSNGSETG